MTQTTTRIATAPTTTEIGLVLIRSARHGRISPRMRTLLHGRYCQAVLRELGIPEKSKGVTEDARMLERAILTFSSSEERRARYEST